MIHLTLNNPGAVGLRILCLGAHSDDIEIGCGGAILRMLDQHPTSTVDWIVFSSSACRRAEAEQAAALFLGVERLNGVVIKDFPDGFMPFEGSAVKRFFEQLKSQISPDVVFTHNRKDAHQDHRLLAELTWNTFRNHLVLEYEIPKYDGDLGQPNLFVPLSAGTCKRKVDYLMKAFTSQHSKRWFEPETFLSLMRLRGMECNSASGYAEAFYCRKMVVCE